MSNSSAGPERARPSATSSKGIRLIHAAALAAVLVPLGSVAVETSTITCGTSANSGSCSGLGFYPAGSGEQTNTWKFFNGSSLLYTLQIAGTPTGNFSLDVNDFVTTQDSLEGTGEGTGALANFPNATCIPTFGGGQCGLFQVFEVNGPATWLNGYELTITWFAAAGPPLTLPPGQHPGRNTILQAKNSTGGVFGNELTDIREFIPDPTDPGISGRGDDFSLFGAFNVPEPGSLALLGMGVAGLLHRVRRRKPNQ